jgi:type II secretory pathway pseudopilin PulG
MKRFLKWAAISLGSLILVVGLFIGWLRWSGDREWKQAEAELRAKGEKLTFAELVPQMPPDSENFYADPLWAEVADLAQNKHESASAVPGWKPRFPRDQWQLHRWETVPLTPEEKDRLSKLMPGGKEIKTRMEALSLLRTKLNQEKNPQKQKEIADLYLGIIAPAQPVLAQIAKLSEKPQAQLSLRYDLGANTPLPHITNILRLAQIISRQALSELVLGKKREAASDTLTSLRLCSTLKNEPLLISESVRISTVAVSLEAINEGILRHAWTEDDLKSFQARLEYLELQKHLLFAVRGERAGFNTFFYSNINNLLKGLSSDEDAYSSTVKAYVFLYPYSANKSKAYQNLFFQQYLESLASNLETGWNKSSIHPIDEEVIALSKNPLKNLIYLLNVLATPSLIGSTRKTTECQTMVDQTLIACALERYRLAHGAYPTSLDSLAPKYLAKLPNSPITGKPMNYSLNRDGSFLLWSPGWNLKSLGGKPSEFKGDGDIVWGQPLPTKPREGSKAKN